MAALKLVVESPAANVRIRGVIDLIEVINLSAKYESFKICNKFTRETS